MTRKSVSKYTESPPTDAITTKYRVSWWTKHPATGAPVFNHLEYDDIGAARRAFKDLPEAAEPSAERIDWSEPTRSWVAQDLVGRGRSPDESRADNARGIQMLRSVLAHKRGVDTRDSLKPAEPRELAEMLAGVESTRGHDHRNGAAGCPVCARRVRQEAPDQCVVCDYLCQHGREPQHPFAGLVQGQLGEQLDERF